MVETGKDQETAGSETHQLRGLDVGAKAQKSKMMVTLLSWAQNTVEAFTAEDRQG